PGLPSLCMSSVLRRPELDAETDACACPECGMPMSIRLWLRMADCLRCGTSIALDYRLPRPKVAKTPVDLSKLPFAKEEVVEPLDAIAIDLSVVPPPVMSRTKKVLRSLHRLLACLLSMIAHLVLLILLAILTQQGYFEPEDDQINLSLEFNDRDREGGLEIYDDEVEQVGFDLPLDPQEERQQ